MRTRPTAQQHAERLAQKAKYDRADRIDRIDRKGDNPKERRYIERLTNRFTVRHTKGEQ